MKKRILELLVIGVAVFRYSSMASGVDESLGSFLRLHGVPRYDYQVITVYPHDHSAFTQGLVLVDGVLYESTGLYGESSLRKVNLETGEIFEKIDLGEAYFAEGITVWEDTIVQLTWESKVAFIYEKGTLRRLGSSPYPYAGWGITSDGENLIAGDGSEVLRFLDPVDFTVKKEIVVRVGERTIDRLNELEYADGRIYANVWHEDLIVVIDPRGGELLGWIDLAELLDPGKGGENVLNGIAFDYQTRTFLITGKRWHSVYRLKVEE
ncbi:MAG: glutaminyl-peptide cyclotransferase [Atribacterota bacterium]